MRIEQATTDGRQSLDGKLPKLTRRAILKASTVWGAAAGASTTGVRLFPHREEVGNTVTFLANRQLPRYEETYMSPTPEEVLPREKSDALFDKLQLAERFSKTLNKNAFYVTAQRVARLASLYFRPDKQQDQRSQDAAFEQFNENFFQKVLHYSDYLEVDFPAVLLMWQVSGANTSSIKAVREDVRDERIRAGSHLAENLLGAESGLLLVDTIRTVENIKENTFKGWYYAAPRVQGPVSLGIHDIETIMISRALRDVQQSLPDLWPNIAKAVNQRSSQFLMQSDSYNAQYDAFEQVSDAITKHVRTSPAMQEYLRKVYTPDNIKKILTTGNTVDAYQFLRTTVFWAAISELNQVVSTSANQTQPAILEQRALNKAIDYYVAEKNPAGFFLDQIANPKMLKQLQLDADQGNEAAKRLLSISQNFTTMSNGIIATDTAIAATIAADKLEDDMDFQILTGVAHSRWLLSDTQKRIHGKSPRKISFNNPDELAYNTFLATANREAGPSYQLAASRPLERATLTFLPMQTTYATMDAFIKQVYQQVEPEHPEKDYKTFLRYFVRIIAERYFQDLFHTHHYSLDASTPVNIEEFIERAEKFGASKNIITPPHSSWMRSVEATIGYISEMTKNQ
jgi:hypothetical protein